MLCHTLWISYFRQAVAPGTNSVVFARFLPVRVMVDDIWHDGCVWAHFLGQRYSYPVRTRLKGVLGNIADEDIEVNVEKGVVYVSISDKLLFSSGSYTVTSRAKEVLGKVAKVINDKPEIEFMVEGHTDNVPINVDGIADNWDLSVKRAVFSNDSFGLILGPCVIENEKGEGGEMVQLLKKNKHAVL